MDEEIRLTREEILEAIAAGMASKKEKTTDEPFLVKFTRAVRARAEKTGKNNFDCMAEVMIANPEWKGQFSDFIFEAGSEK
jgi:hypothetical protein